MKIKVDDIKLAPVNLSAEESVDDYPALLDLIGSGECDFVAPIAIELTAMQEYDHIRVDGSVATKVRLRCSRCIEEYEADISSTFTLFYNKTSGVPLDAEQELQDADFLTVSYEGDYIDFTAEIEEQLVMEVPYKPLCSDECVGLCSKCGANLNNGDCGCGREEPSFKFSALKNFKVNK